MHQNVLTSWSLQKISKWCGDANSSYHRENLHSDMDKKTHVKMDRRKDDLKPRCDKRDLLSRWIARWCGRNVIHCRARYSVAIDAIIASGNARVLLNQGGIGMPYVRNFCPQAHNSAARRKKKSVPERFLRSPWRNRRVAQICTALIATLGWKSTKPIKTRCPAVPPTATRNRKLR